MKKTILTFAFIICCSMAASLSAQEKGFQVGVWYQMSTDKPFSKKYNFNSVDLVIAPGYSFNGRLFVRVPFSFATELYRTPVKTYSNNIRIGGTVGYDIVSNNKIGVIELAATVGGSLLSNKSRYVYYDLGAMWNLGYMNKMSIGFGVRYYQSQAAGFKNYTTMFVSVGFRFN